MRQWFLLKPTVATRHQEPWLAMEFWDLQQGAHRVHRGTARCQGHSLALPGGEVHRPLEENHQDGHGRQSGALPLRPALASASWQAPLSALVLVQV
mmetsp:Transcript_35942/g.99674  ORF Transcript_35942/g.99674 Transcript_35942/m.99674 type:complete len:96 (+) Transcript_35942:153-440(+)